MTPETFSKLFFASAEYQLPFTPLIILICLSFYQITKLYTFLDYVMGGCQINFTVSDTNFACTCILGFVEWGWGGGNPGKWWVENKISPPCIKFSTFVPFLFIRVGRVG